MQFRGQYSCFLSALTALVLLAGPRELSADTPDNFVPPAVARLRTDVTYLASDLRGGRGVGTRGIDDAADYLALIFREAGLKPASGAEGYFQPFSIRGDVRLGKSALSFTLPNDHTVTAEKFTPLAIGATGKVEGAPVVFAGFGITAKDEDSKLDYDDYADVDAKDKVVLIIRRKPEPADKESPFHRDAAMSFATFQHKVVNATRHGAKAVLLVNDAPSAKDNDALLVYDATPRGGGIPFFMLSRASADQILASAGAPKLDELESRINETSKPQSRALAGVRVSGEVELSRDDIQAKNVIGVLEGQGPLSNETIIVGGHYDHLGNGGMGSLEFGSREIHNGADDNASGTSTVLELARRLAARPEPLPRRVVFMLFSGEERGLLGSAHYVSNPLYPLDKTVAMLNFDMVGRLNDARDITVYGTMSSDGFAGLVEAIARSFALNPKMPKPINDGFSDSDHSSFYRKDIPILFFFTGTHPDYHKPSDDSDKINYEGMARIAAMGELILLDLAQRPSRPVFAKPTATVRSQPADPGAVRGNGAYLGSRPAYGEDVEGVKLDGVTEGSPAEKAGLRAGDVIVQFAELPVKDIESYMLALSSKKPGDDVEIVVKRGGKDVTLKAKLGTRQSARPSD